MTKAEYGRQHYQEKKQNDPTFMLKKRESAIASYHRRSADPIIRQRRLDRLRQRRAAGYWKTPENKARVQVYDSDRYRRDKEQVLTHYGKNGKLQCCWPGCEIIDIDILTLDHTNGGGTKERRGSGVKQYRRVIRDGFPESFQTLCWNHQWKKFLLMKRQSELPGNEPESGAGTETSPL